MGKTYRKMDPIRIEQEDLLKVRKTWGKVQPFTRVEEDKFQRRNREACRKYKYQNLEE
jgi:hypothetical protein